MRDKSDLAKAYIRAHPVEFLRLTAIRCMRFWTGSGNQDGSVVFVIHALLTSSLAAIGLGRLLREQRRSVAVLFLVPLILFPLPYYISHAEFRYRLVIDPLLDHPGWIWRVRFGRFRGFGEGPVKTAPLATWLRWTLPPFADVFFLVVVRHPCLQPPARRSAARPRYWLAHKERRAHLGHQTVAQDGSIFLHPARPALVRMGVDLRPRNCRHSPCIRTKRGGAVYR